MPQILKNDEWSFVVLDNGIIRKTIRKVKSSDKILYKTTKENTDREIRALGLLKDIEGIRKVIQRESDNTFIAHYIPGISLEDYKKHLPKSFFNKLSSMLKECYSKGIYNLDVKTNNIIVKPDLRPALIDFGFVLFSDDKLAPPGTGLLAKIYYPLRAKDLSRRYNHL